MNDQTTHKTQKETLAAIVGEFPSPKSLRDAAARIHSAGFVRFDAYSPFPIHGIERAAGIRSTRLPWLVLFGGLTGGVFGLWLQWWTNAVDFPLLISGKPFFSLPANIPVVFELTVLFSAFAAFFGVLALNRLPQFHTPLFRSAQFRRATTDGFFLVVDSTDPQFEEARVRQLLESLGANSVEAVYASAEPAPIPRPVLLGAVIVVLLAAIPPLAIAVDRLTPSSMPRMHPVRDMDDQPKLKTQAATSLFRDRRTMRAPVPGTVARGELREDDAFYLGQKDGQFVDSFPERLGPITMELMDRGRHRFNIYCAPCHGLAGDGDGIVSLRALQREDSAGWVKPLSLHSDVVRDQPVGKLFHTISNGIRTMPSYATQISPRDRWAIVLYVKALQRSRNATIQDLPEDLRPALSLREGK